MSQAKPSLLKGFRDYLPDVELTRRTMLDRVTGVFEGFGFGPLQTPAIEYSEVLLGKYGDEGEKLLYRFTDNGERDVALRYDLTVPLARIVAMYGDIPKPFRRYQVAPVWRAEKPGRGRFREFMQCDVDIIGEPSIRADAECMIVGLEVLRALEVDGVVMRVNNRKILDGMLDAVGVTEREARHAVMRAIDKLPKIGRAGVSAEIRETVGLDDAGLETLFAVLDRKIAGAADLAALTPVIGGSETGVEGIAELTELLGVLEAAGLGDQVEVDLSIARGLDYYTATIYETFLVGHEEYGSVMSGGRYDTLLGMFLKQSLPAVGISLGVDRLLAALLELELIPPRKTAADVFIALFDEEGYAEHVKLARVLREHGLRSELSLSPAKLGKQFKLAERKGYRFIMLAGPDERAAGIVNIKDLASGEQSRLALADVAEWASRFAL
ncbi:MAG: histidine--tRNA ligase [Deltaproteobacteria bacterium]|nr:MAG: histidine--tRNA ligase [Deltaproteobacteria bacterium]